MLAMPASTTRPPWAWAGRFFLAGLELFPIARRAARLHKEGDETEATRGDHRRRLRRPLGGAPAVAPAGARHARRSLEPSLVFGAAAPGGDGRPRARRNRRADPRRAPPPRKRARAARRSDGRGSGAAARADARVAA